MSRPSVSLEHVALRPKRLPSDTDKNTVTGYRLDVYSKQKSTEHDISKSSRLSVKVPHKHDRARAPEDATDSLA